MVSYSALGFGEWNMSSEAANQGNTATSIGRVRRFATIGRGNTGNAQWESWREIQTLCIKEEFLDGYKWKGNTVTDH